MGCRQSIENALRVVAVQRCRRRRDQAWTSCGAPDGHRQNLHGAAGSARPIEDAPADGASPNIDTLAVVGFAPARMEDEIAETSKYRLAAVKTHALQHW